MPASTFAEARWPGYAASLKSTMQSFIRLARLVHHIRRIQQRPGDGDLRSEAAGLASRLFGSSLEGWIGQLMGSGAIEVVPSSVDNVQVSHSFRFESPRLYQLLVAFWTSRVILCGCIQKLACLAPDGRLPSSLNILAVQEMDIQSATSIFMYVFEGFCAPCLALWWGKHFFRVKLRPIDSEVLLRPHLDSSG